MKELNRYPDFEGGKKDYKRKRIAGDGAVDERLNLVMYDAHIGCHWVQNNTNR